jgi:hypothetical protein
MITKHFSGLQPDIHPFEDKLLYSVHQDEYQLVSENIYSSNELDEYERRSKPFALYKKNEYSNSSESLLNGQNPKWNNDGSKIFYSYWKELYEYDMDKQTQALLFSIPEDICEYNISPNEEKFFIVTASKLLVLFKDEIIKKLDCTEHSYNSDVYTSKTAQWLSNHKILFQNKGDYFTYDLQTDCLEKIITNAFSVSANFKNGFIALKKPNKDNKDRNKHYGELYYFNANGSHFEQIQLEFIGKKYLLEENPKFSWSKNGRFVVLTVIENKSTFFSTKLGEYKIGVFDSQSKNLVQLMTYSNQYEAYPLWLKDDKRIGIYAGGQFNIYDLDIN